MPQLIGNSLFILRGIVRVMCHEDKAEASTDNRCEFGVLAEVLLTLQREELEQTETCPPEIPETNITQNTIEIMTEINTTLKEIAETQKSILEEIKKNRTG